MNYRRPKFLEVLLDIRQEMAREADYDVDLFAEMVRGAGFSETLRDIAVAEDKGDGERKSRRPKPAARPGKAKV